MIKRVSDTHQERLSKCKTLVDKMIKKGLCEEIAFQDQVEEAMKFTDDALVTLERVIDRYIKE